MMTSSNGNIFRVTGHLCVEFTGLRLIPAQRPVTQSFDIFFDLRLNKQLSKQSWGWWFETLSCPLWRQCNVQTMFDSSFWHGFVVRSDEDWFEITFIAHNRSLIEVSTSSVAHVRGINVNRDRFTGAPGLGKREQISASISKKYALMWMPTGPTWLHMSSREIGGRSSVPILNQPWPRCYISHIT